MLAWANHRFAQSVYQQLSQWSNRAPEIGNHCHCERYERPNALLLATGCNPKFKQPQGPILTTADLVTCSGKSSYCFLKRHIAVVHCEIVGANGVPVCVPAAPHHTRAGKVAMGRVWGQFRRRSAKIGVGRGAFREQEGMDFGGASTCPILSLFSWPIMPPVPPHIMYIWKIAGVGPRRPIDGQADYREVCKNYFYLPLLGSLVTSPLWHALSALTTWLHHVGWCGNRLGHKFHKMYIGDKAIHKIPFLNNWHKITIWRSITIFLLRLQNVNMQGLLVNVVRSFSGNWKAKAEATRKV